MTQTEAQEKREAWIIDYLYGELNEEQKQVFERSLENDPELKALYESHTAMDIAMPKGSRPVISDDRMQGVRWSALRKLKQAPPPSLLDRIKDFFNVQLSMKVQLGGMAMMFAAGLIVSGGVSTGQTPLPEEDIAQTTNDAALAFIGSNDYDILDVQLASYNPAAGEVEFSYSLASQSRVQGNLNNPKVRAVLVRSLTAETNDDVRLQVSEMFGEYATQDDVRKALINTLLTDPNPGVRYNAVSHLVKQVERLDVRTALQSALVNDVNAGVRVEAFLALTENPDASTLQILKEHSVNDANTLIRERSKKMINTETPDEPGNDARAI